MFDFDRVIERRGTHASKWDKMAALSGIDAPDAIPMWVADMDFAAPPGVTEALAAVNRRAVHGYYADTGTWAAALADWMGRRHGLKVDPAWVSPTPGVVSALGLIIQATSEPGDEVVVFPPAYHAFRRIILANERRILDAQLAEANGRYVMDLDGLRAKLTPRTRIVFFCSPHNPGGTVWSPDEIRALATFCEEHDLLLVSDEIHCDLVYPGAKHTPTLTAAPEIADRLVTTVAATKTFNLAGAHVGACITTNRDLKRRIDARIVATGLGSYNAFGMIATEAAWRTGEAWLEALLSYLAKSRDLFDCAHRGGSARRPLHAPRGNLSCLGRLLRHRPGPRGGVGQGQEPRAPLPEPRLAVRAGRRDLAALQLRHAARHPGGGARPAGRRLPRSAHGPVRAEEVATWHSRPSCWNPWTGRRVSR